jgi:glycosyltransferase involved in cell wall biosynthesis
MSIEASAEASSGVRRGDGRKRLTVDARMIGNSGIGVYLANVLGRLAERGNLSVTVLGKEPALSRFPWFRKVGFHPLRSPIYSLGEQWELPLRVPACDLFWTPHFNVPFLPVKARRRVATIHDVYHLAFRDSMGTARRLYARLLYGRASRSDALITVSHFSASEIRRHIAGRIAPITVIPNGVDARFRPGSGAGGGAAGSADGGKAGKRGDYILAVGNVKPHKNMRALIEAFAKLAGGFPGLRLFIVGKAEGMLTVERGLEGLAESLVPGRVVFTGHVMEEELRDLYANARLFVFPSLYEGFGLPLLEAMASGLPIAASDRGPMREVAGDSVSYFDPLDTGDMAAKISAALSDPKTPPLEDYARRLGEFTWERSAEAHAELFERLST